MRIESVNAALIDNEEALAQLQRGGVLAGEAQEILMRLENNGG